MLNQYLKIALTVLSTTYGHGEKMCGDIGRPVSCSKGAITASGIEFDPTIPMAAVAAPTRMILRPRYIYLKIDGGPCVRILLADKMNPRYIGKRGFDFTPAAVAQLTSDVPTPHWSDQVKECDPNWDHFEFLTDNERMEKCLDSYLCSP